MDQTEHFPKWSRWEHQGPRISRTRWKKKAQKSPPLFVLDGCPPRPTSFQNRDLLAHRQGEARVFSDSFCIISIVVKAQGCPGQERGVYEKSYKEKIHLKRHKTLHFWRKLFKSRRCFLQTWELTMHQRTHTGEKSYSCSQCAKSSSQISNFWYWHIHTSERPFRLPPGSVVFWPLLRPHHSPEDAHQGGPPCAEHQEGHCRGLEERRSWPSETPCPTMEIGTLVTLCV